MDEKLQRDLNDLLYQFEFITTAQATGQAQATAADTVPLDEPHYQQPLQPIIVYLVDTPPPEAYDASDQDASPEADADEQEVPRNIVESQLKRDHGHRSTSAPKDEAASTSDNDGHQTQAAGPVTRPRPKGKRVLLVGMLCLVLVGAAMMVSLVSFTQVSATVTILPVATQIAVTSRLTVVSGTADPLQQEVPGRLLASLTLAQARTVPTTGTGHQEAQAAHGLLTFYNASLDVQTVPAGTTLSTAQGVVIVTDQDAVIPAAPTLQTNGQVTVPAHAVPAGPAGNLSAGEIYGPCCRLNVSVANSVFTGGQNARSYPLVTAQDVNGATASLLTSLQASAQAAFQAQVRRDESLLPPACTPQVRSDQHVGDEARQITVTLTETCTGETYQTQALHTLITQMVTAEAQKRLGTGYQVNGDVQSRVTASNRVPGQQRGRVTLEVRGTGTWSYQFDEVHLHTIASMIAGKSRQQATTLLLHWPGVSQVAMNVSGTDTTTLPRDPARIHLVVLAQAGL